MDKKCLDCVHFDGDRCIFHQNLVVGDIFFTDSKSVGCVGEGCSDFTRLKPFSDRFQKTDFDKFLSYSYTLSDDGLPF